MQGIPIAYWLLIGMFLLGMVYRVFRVSIKGKIGEKKVGLVLSMLSSEKFKVLNDVVLDIDGRTSQIDHIVVSDYGLFVIETKNYSGWILGSENADYWTQVIFQRKEKFYNPIRQNHSHILALKNVLKQFPKLKYVSVVVFSSKATLKVSTETAVIHPLQLLGYIKEYSEIHLTKDEKQEIFAVVELLNSVDTYDRKLHTAKIRQSVQMRDEAISQRQCPRCGSRLLERNGRYGSFLGCSGFPKCKFTSQI
jgi:hypothetical protein